MRVVSCIAYSMHDRLCLSTGQPTECIRRQRPARISVAFVKSFECLSCNRLLQLRCQTCCACCVYANVTELLLNSCSCMSFDVSSNVLMQAADALLEQHHTFSEAELMSYLQECYPHVPEEYRRPLILGAVAGAQRAAHMAVIVEKNTSSPDANKHAVAVNASSFLSFWNVGLRKTYPTVSSSASWSMSAPSQQPLSMSEYDRQPGIASFLADIQFPVSMQQSQQDRENTMSSQVLAATSRDAPLFVHVDGEAAMAAGVLTMLIYSRD